jgi:hypothetical protein
MFESRCEYDVVCKVGVMILDFVIKEIFVKTSAVPGSGNICTDARTQFSKTKNQYPNMKKGAKSNVT